MNTNNNDKVSIDWGGARGAIWTLAGAAIATVAQRGGLGGFLGGMPPPPPPVPLATQRDLTYERELTVANAKIGQLEAEKYADSVTLAAERRLADKIEKIEVAMNAATTTQAVLNAKQEAFIGGLAAQVESFNRMTQRFINPVVMSGSEAIVASFKANAASASTTAAAA